MDICFYFQVHQPYRFREYSIFDIGSSQQYFNDASNREIFLKVAENCYNPANQLVLDLLKKHKKFKCAFSLSGTFLQQSQDYMPEILNSFRRLLSSGNVEFLNETFYHSLASVFSRSEFVEQVDKHKRALKDLFACTPTSFRNTELIYNDAMAHLLSELGYKTILAEGVVNKDYCDCPNYFYNVAESENTSVMLRNSVISDLLTFNFVGSQHKAPSLDPKKVAKMIVSQPGEVVNIFIDYEFLGEHHKNESGIFCFLEALISKLEHMGANFILPSEVPVQSDQDYNCPEFSSWADNTKDLGAWLSNNMQNCMAQELYGLESKIKACSNKELLETWRKMQTSDHFYYMFTNAGADYNAHRYFSPFAYPHEMFISFQNILRDFKERLG